MKTEGFLEVFADRINEKTSGLRTLFTVLGPESRKDLRISKSWHPVSKRNARFAKALPLHFLSCLVTVGLK